MNKKKMKTHWAADIFPLHEGDIDAIAEDIKANGQLVPITALPDGRIIDGRNRFLACEKAGVDPIIETVELEDDKEIFAMAVSLNGKRRQTVKSQSAIAAALAWRELFPGEQRRARKCKSALSFADFSNGAFGVSERLAKKAQAILNWSEELLMDAMQSGDLDGKYKIYRDEKSKRDEKRRIDKLISESEHQDIAERVANGALTADEALTLLRKRDKELADREAEEQRRVLDIGQHLQLSLIAGKVREETIRAALKELDLDPSDVSSGFRKWADEIDEKGQIL